MRYLPLTDGDRRKMMDRIGISSIDELFQAIPPAARLHRPLNLPGPLSELELTAHMRRLAAANRHVDELVSFLGGGAYDRFVPAVVRHVVARSEFYTAYTPYQPEVSQGVLQVIYEFQTMICRLTGMEAANASMYDASTALAEAAAMSCGATGRSRVLVAGSVHPEYRRVTATYLAHQDREVVTVPLRDGRLDRERLEALLDEKVAAVLIQQPNFFGILEEVDGLADRVHQAGALLVVAADPVSLGILKPPAAYGADVAVGDVQPLGNALSFGGPYAGYFAVRQTLLRRMPGRLAGMTTDRDGRRGFVLTLQAREQHIRRERATSNICTNNALNALAATVYLATAGPHGLAEVATRSTQLAHVAQERLCQIPGVRLAWEQPFLFEFALELPKPAHAVVRALLDDGFLAGLPLGRFAPQWERLLLVAVTETRTLAEIEQLAHALERALQA
ncbi:aminomethyl-transferring glycine dehydrogenase subunit GcvPA [Limnochorda sp.]|uniref:aminomethyl-transferring glycine dehydrogenase subunit GcvPA n=1 Tax=Limnochorda sp. TaxID=1940279 RepID=UPI001D36DEC6|nr:aminomethyl-transferring glycine dehydrogenase [Bacillota bacterium]MBO2519021.1 aminomethyl-transferring glycine dehydrogenase [Bacillota bacterium]